MSDLPNDGDDAVASEPVPVAMTEALPPPPAPPPPAPPTTVSAPPLPPPPRRGRSWPVVLAATIGFVLGALVVGGVGLAVREHRRVGFHDMRSTPGRTWSEARDRPADAGSRRAPQRQQGPDIRPRGDVTGPTVVQGGGADGHDIVVWPDGRTVTLPNGPTAVAPTTTPS